jgi:phenylpropionate dioxygenase-like ring-hydroxylating dioxygenase large terminal subunit
MELLENFWYVVLESSELKSNKPLKAKRFGKTLVFWRDGDKVNVVDDRCPHRGASLSSGSVNNGCITCPFHGIAFDGDGDCKKIPYLDELALEKTLSVKSYRVTERDGFIWLWNGRDLEDGGPKVFDELKRGYAFNTMKETWNTHYSRAIENQLDYYHLPFVHKNTIGRGFKPASGLDISRKLKVDFENWTILAKMDTGKLNGGTSFKFLFPNSWILTLSPFAFLYVAFCPIDEENTQMYLRTYLKGSGLKTAKKWALFASPVFNRKILDEDKAVVLTQTPKAISPDMDEKLLALDKPIAVFREQYFKYLKESYL